MKRCRQEPKLWDGETYIQVPVGPTAFGRVAEMSLCSSFQILQMKRFVPSGIQRHLIKLSAVVEMFCSCAVHDDSSDRMELLST